MYICSVSIINSRCGFHRSLSKALPPSATDLPTSVDRMWFQTAYEPNRTKFLGILTESSLALGCLQYGPLVTRISCNSRAAGGPDLQYRSPVASAWSTWSRRISDERHWPGAQERRFQPPEQLTLPISTKKICFSPMDERPGHTDTVQREGLDPRTDSSPSSSSLRRVRIPTPFHRGTRSIFLLGLCSA